MSTIFKDQELLSIILDTNIDVDSATTLEVLYEKPDGTSGAWAGVAFETTKIKYNVQEGDLDQVGDWRFQSHIVIGGEDGYGDIVVQPVLEKIA